MVRAKWPRTDKTSFGWGAMATQGREGFVVRGMTRPDRAKHGQHHQGQVNNNTKARLILINFVYSRSPALGGFMLRTFKEQGNLITFQEF